MIPATAMTAPMKVVGGRFGIKSQALIMDITLFLGYNNS